MSQQYRPDIDGLRAVAVLPVLLFHFGVSPFTGGFVGVDVFFVISGFLITGILFRDIEAGRFSLASFYGRRIRRILPALAAVIVATLIAGWFIQLPHGFTQLGEQSASAIFGLGNIYFWMHSSYFETASEYQPLLHTWSLGVEEQFYLMWPLLLWFAVSRLGMRAHGVLALLAGIVLVSLVMAQMSLAEAPETSFYMIHTRAWELAIGAAIVFLPPLRGRFLQHATGIVGLGFIAYGVFGLTSASPFPGLNAVLPCVGAALIVWPSEHRMPVARILSLRPLVYIGKISYSLYLWHWPVLVFYRLAHFGHQPSASATIALILLSFLLAALSERYIERPFRRIRRAPWPTIGVGFAAMAIVAASGGAIASAHGFPSRLTDEARRYLSYEDQMAQTPSKKECFVSSHKSAASFPLNDCIVDGLHKVLLFGDSHAAHFAKALRDAYPDVSFSQVTKGSCHPVLPPRGSPGCQGLVTKVIKEVIPKQRFDMVILSARWRAGDIKGIKRTIAAIAPYVGQIVVFGRTQEYKYDLPILLARATMRGDSKRKLVRAQSKAKALKKLDEKMAKAFAKSDTEYYSVWSAVCPRQCILTVQGDVPMEIDYGHFSYEGARFVLSKLADQGFDPLASNYQSGS